MIKSIALGSIGEEKIVGYADMGSVLFGQLILDVYRINGECTSFRRRSTGNLLLCYVSGDGMLREKELTVGNVASNFKGKFIKINTKLINEKEAGGRVGYEL